MEDNKQEKNRVTKLTRTPNGQLSVTRVIAILSTALCISLIPIAVVLYTCLDLTLPDNIFNYALGLLGITTVFYGGTKVKQYFEER